MVIQRVSYADVTIGGSVKASIDKGLLVLVGIENADLQEDADWLSRKLVDLRIFNDDSGKPNFSVKEVQGDILLISQFTLHASTQKGNRPGYIRAARPERAIPLYEKLIERISSDLGKPIFTGTFGADMQVKLINDGPLTICIDSRNRE
jgi:D-tyrosyl-tRNA(Tyr) deacylase